jgi:ribulose-phosphate 3-epimerase
MKKIAIYPSLISAHVLELKNEIDRLKPYVQGFHLDVMDMHFVPNLTLGPLVVNAVAAYVPEGLFVHLMVSDPLKVCNAIQAPPGIMMTFHYESLKSDSERVALVRMIQERGWRVGIALKPETPVHVLESQVGDGLLLINIVDQVLIMSVEPGFSGQLFMPASIGRVRAVATLINQVGVTCTIAVDGGIGRDNIGDLVAAGACEFAVASAIFSSSDPISAVYEIQAMAHGMSVV